MACNITCIRHAICLDTPDCPVGNTLPCRNDCQIFDGAYGSGDIPEDDEQPNDGDVKGLSDWNRYWGL